MSQDHVYSLVELCSLVDVSPRTVRYYIAQGLLPPPGGSGPGARYSGPHLDRLRLVRRLQQEHLPLAEIRSRLSALTDDDVAALLAEPTPAEPADERSGEQSALEYIRSILGPTAGNAPGGSLRSKLLFATQVGRPPAQLALERRLYSHPATTAAEVAGEISPPEDRPRARAVAPPSEASDGRDLARDPGGASAAQRSTSPASVAASPEAAPARSQWDRIVLAQDIELHIRRPLSRLQNRRVERLIAVARELLEED